MRQSNSPEFRWERDPGHDRRANPWHLDDSTESILFLTDESDRPARIGFSITASGVHYYLTSLKLAPHETRAINLRQLRDAQKPDFKKNMIPAGATDGSVNWIRLDNVAVSGRVVVLNRSGGTASAYDCCACPCPDSYCCVSVAPSSFAIAVWGWYSCFASAQYDDCNGVQSHYDVTGNSAWSSQQPSIASVNAYGDVTGVSSGSATVVASYSDYVYNDVPGYGCIPSMQSSSSSCPGTVGCGTPAVTSVDPDTWPAGQTTSGTISGAFFGTNPAVSISDPAISFSYSAVNDGQISFSATVPSNNPGEVVTITVTSQGCAGSGGAFAPATQGQPASDTGQVTVTAAPAAGAFLVEYSSYIPVDNVTGAAYCYPAITPAISVFYLYKGDANRTTFRTRQFLTLSPGAQTSSGYTPRVGETRQYGYGSPANGSTLSAADEDGVPHDCYLWNDSGHSTNPAFTETVGFSGSQGQTHYTGSASDPFEVQFGSIKWDMTIVVDVTNPQSPTAQVTGSHTCYPSHQIKVNGKVVYLYTPTRDDTPYIVGCLTGIFSQVNAQAGPVSVPTQ